MSELRLQDVQRKARFGHKDWLYWKDRDGLMHSAPKSLDSMKKCLLEAGTKGWWCLITANTGTLMKGFWYLGIVQIAQMKRGWF